VPVQVLADPVVVVPQEEAEGDDDEVVEPPGPNVPNYPRKMVADAVENALDGFKASRADDVVKTLGQVRNRLEILTDQRHRLERALAGDDAAAVRSALAAVVEWADAQRKHLT
jgi:hypothetical protein